MEDVIGDLSDDAINNISQRKQETEGFNGQIMFTDDLFAKGNQLILGFSYFEGTSYFNSILELANLDPVARRNVF